MTFLLLRANIVNISAEDQIYINIFGVFTVKRSESGDYFQVDIISSSNKQK